MNCNCSENLGQHRQTEIAALEAGLEHTKVEKLQLENLVQELNQTIESLKNEFNRNLDFYQTKIAKVSFPYLQMENSCENYEAKIETLEEDVVKGLLTECSLAADNINLNDKINSMASKFISSGKMQSMKSSKLAGDNSQVISDGIDWTANGRLETIAAKTGTQIADEMLIEVKECNSVLGESR